MNPYLNPYSAAEARDDARAMRRVRQISAELPYIAARDTVLRCCCSDRGEPKAQRRAAERVPGPITTLARQACEDPSPPRATVAAPHSQRFYIPGIRPERGFQPLREFSPEISLLFYSSRSRARGTPGDDNGSHTPIGGSDQAPHPPELHTRPSATASAP